MLDWLISLGIRAEDPLADAKLMDRADMFAWLLGLAGVVVYLNYLSAKYISVLTWSDVVGYAFGIAVFAGGLAHTHGFRWRPQPKQDEIPGRPRERALWQFIVVKAMFLIFCVCMLVATGFSLGSSAD